MQHKKFSLFSAFVLLNISSVVAQKNLALNKDFVFSAIKGTTSKPDSISFPGSIIKIASVGGDVSSFKLSAHKNGRVVITFSPAADFVGTARSRFAVKNATGKTIANINLTGLSTNAWEGENEAPLVRIIDALGYKNNIGWATLANHTKPELQGDEISAALFKKAGPGKVEILPVARYSPDFELPFGYYLNKTSGPDKHEVGVLSTKGTYPEHQTLFPAVASGTDAFDPGQNAFGFYATGNAHSAYSQDAWNILLHPDHAMHATRIYPVKDKEGRLLKNTYLVCFEEAKNGDYNDYVFLVKNIKPVNAVEDFTNLFNGKNLDGWDIFLSGKALNNDPEKNFVVQQDQSLYVKGKELGYIRTQKGFSNYHFVVDFKWGEKKWPPRENAKRDAGICYNIPDNEPDSIWPQSIECQIQEGDTGDFWLLGFSTITVNDSTNKPTNHTRMVKKADAEKPTGEWNTVEVISYNGKCIHIVNGVVVNAGEKASTTKGRILLQSEYAEVYYRNAKIKQL